MVLTVLDRLMIINFLLPKEGNAVTLRLRTEMVGKIGLSKEEFESFEVVSLPNGGINWNHLVDQGTEIPLGETELKLIREVVTGLERSSKLPMDCLPIYEKLMAEAEK